MCLLAQWLAYSKHSINYIFASKYTESCINIQYQSYKYISKNQICNDVCQMKLIHLECQTTYETKHT